MAQSQVFSYKAGTSLIHRIPSWCKILFIPVFNILIFSLNWKFAVCFVAIQMILGFSLKFSIKEQYTDLTPVIFYAFCLYFLNIFTGFMELFQNPDFSFSQFSPEILQKIISSSFSDTSTGITLIKFLACVQSASIMFKTSTSLQLREGIELIELKIRKVLPVKKEPVFAETVSMFINFIPAVFRIWNQLKRAWIARNGKNSLRMIMALLPVLFSESLKHALQTTKAILNRKK